MKTPARWVKCNGEAHRNPMIDNCMVCIPYWGRFPLCPDEGRKLNHTGYCPGCKKFFEVDESERDFLESQAEFKVVPAGN